MANRRMFSKQIVDSDAFLDMPASSQLLYFHLNMQADDDGFVGNPKKVIRTIGASSDDFKILVAKRFILTFETGVMVIKHWKLHNYIQNDRYHETQYIEEKSSLIIKENGAYTECIQDVSKVLPEVRLGKVSLGESKVRLPRADKPLKDKFETNKYPKENYKKVLDEYQRLKGIKLQGDEFLPPMAEIKRMFKATRTVEQINETMEICEENYEDWAMSTVRMKIADVVGGKLRSKNKKKELTVLESKDI